MYILAVDTAANICSIALAEDGKIIAQKIHDNPREQAQILVPYIQDVLKDAGIGFQDIDLLAVTTGPGSFTGLRIGLAAMRGLSMSLGIKLVGISCFDMYAYACTGCSFSEGRKILVALESKRKELFFQLYDEAFQAVGDALNCTPDALSTEIREGILSYEIVVVGDAAEKIKALYPFNDNIVFNDVAVGTANTLAHMAYDRFVTGTANPDDFPPVPYYVRPPDVTVSQK